MQKLNKRKFTDNDDFLREAKFVKMEKSDALPHKGGLEVLILLIVFQKKEIVCVILTGSCVIFW